MLLDAQPVKRDVGLFLLPDVLRDRRLVQADGGHVVALGPELPVAELVPHVRVPVEYHQRALPFRQPITLGALYFGGIASSIWT